MRDEACQVVGESDGLVAVGAANMDVLAIDGELFRQVTVQLGD